MSLQTFICKRGRELRREAPLGLTCSDYWGRVRSLKTSPLHSSPHWRQCPSHSSAGLWNACECVISLITASKSLNGQDALYICNRSLYNCTGHPQVTILSLGDSQCLRILLGWLLSEPEASLDCLWEWRQRPSCAQSSTARTADSWSRP